MIMRYFFWFFCINSLLYSQSGNWWVVFSDKECSQVIELSDRALERRIKQGIKLDFYDFSVCEEYITVLTQYNLHIRNTSRWLNAVSVKVDSKEVLDQISNLSFVKDIYPVRKMVKQTEISLFKEHIPDYYNPRTFSSLLYGSSYNQIDMLGGVDLHNAGFLGNDMIIAVFDAGFIDVESLPIFENLWVNNQILESYDFVDKDNNVFKGSSHGTMVLSTMGGYMPDSLIGTAPQAKYMLFRTEDSGSETLIEEDNWAAAAEFADSAGVDIINSSLGYTILYDDLDNSHAYEDMDGNSTIITNAADLAASRGILVINSAGNSGSGDWYYIGAPADGDSVLAVGAVNNNGQIASFSSRGPSYDGRIKPNVCAQGVSSVVADLDSTIRLANGTSFSSPIIAGLAACLWESQKIMNNDVNNMDIIDMIQTSAHLFQSPNDSLGYGIPNFYQAYQNSILFNNDLSLFDINLYPNPFKDQFSIQNNNSVEFTFDIFNMFGILVYSQKTNEAHLTIRSLSNYSPGIYFLKIRETSALYPILKTK